MVTVHQTTHAPAKTATWINNILDPAIKACKFENPPPLELRPTGVWGGWCPSKNSAPDGRLSISSRVVFWSKDGFVEVYLHEACHRLLPSDFFHNPAFFCLLHVLLSRVDRQEKKSESPALVSRLSLYDMQDAPAPLEHLPAAEWLPKSISWAVKTAQEIDESVSAERAAEAVVLKYKAWLQQLLAEPGIEARATLQRAQQAAALNQVLIDATEDKKRWKKRAIALSIFLFLSVVTRFA